MTFRHKSLLISLVLLACAVPGEADSGPSASEIQATAVEFCEHQETCSLSPPPLTVEECVEKDIIPDLENKSPECQWKGVAFYQCFSDLTCNEWHNAHSSTPPPSCRDEWVAYFDQEPCADQGDR